MRDVATNRELQPFSDILRNDRIDVLLYPCHRDVVDRKSPANLRVNIILNDLYF